MNYSRRQLERMGEPLGDSVTRIEAGRLICGGGGGGSSSSNSTTTQATDKRMVVDQGIGISSDSSTVTVNALDGDIVKKALDTVSAADATAGAGFSQLLGLADKLFTGAGSMIEKTQSASLAQLETINAAAADQQGTIDQKTMIVLAVAAAGAFVLSRKARA